MPMSTPKSMPELMLDSWMLAGEAGFVMWLRGMRLLTGGKLAEREAQRMVTEKVMASMTLWPALMMGGLGQTPEDTAARTLAHYRTPVRANRRRLAR